MSIQQGRGGLTGNAQPEVVRMKAGIGIGQRVRFGRDMLSVLVGVLVLFFRTFFVGNLAISES